MITVKFKNVGRNKKSWEITMPVLSEDAMRESVIKDGELHSREIDFDIESDEVLVGGYRAVGEFTIHDDKAEKVVAE